MKAAIGFAIKVYRKSPFYPVWGRRFAKLLSFVRRRDETFIHDLGRFKINLDLANVIDNHIYYTGQWEPDTEKIIRQLVKPDSVCLDIGANIGYFTLTLAELVGRHGKVLAFEPTQYARKRLRENVALNGYLQVDIYPNFVSDKKGRQEVKIESTYRLDGRSSAETQEIEAITIDSLDLAKLEFIKIDTDGNETHIIRGGRQTLKRLKPAMLFEVSSFLTNHSSSPSELLTELASLDYQFYEESTMRPYESIDQIVDSIPTGRGINVVGLYNTKSQ